MRPFFVVGREALLFHSWEAPALGRGRREQAICERSERWRSERSDTMDGIARLSMKSRVYNESMLRFQDGVLASS